MAEPIFISYARADAEDFAKRLHDLLERERIDVWLDKRDIKTGIDWDTQIWEAIDSCIVFVFIITPGSRDSEVCRKEFERAYKASKRIAPILLAVTEPKPAFLPEKMHYINYLKLGEAATLAELRHIREEVSSKAQKQYHADNPQRKNLQLKEQIGPRKVWLVIGVIFLCVLFAVLAISFSSQATSLGLPGVQTAIAKASIPTFTSTFTPTATFSRTPSQTPTSTYTPSQTLTPSSTTLPEIATRVAQLAKSASFVPTKRPSLTPSRTPTIDVDVAANGTMERINASASGTALAAKSFPLNPTVAVPTRDPESLPVYRPFNITALSNRTNSQIPERFLAIIVDIIVLPYGICSAVVSAIFPNLGAFGVICSIIFVFVIEFLIGLWLSEQKNSQFVERIYWYGVIVSLIGLLLYRSTLLGTS